jgi:hypothetical protein
MSNLKPYYVTVDHSTFKDEVLTELKSTSGDDVIPPREVEVADDHPGSERVIQVYLTDEEAVNLVHDLRVTQVELDPEEFYNVKKTHMGVRTGNFNLSPTTNLESHKNYGLLRATTTTNYWTSAYGVTNVPFGYNLDGTGVDIVVFDTGVASHHPEFAVNADGTGGTRVVDIDWTQYGFITSAPQGGFMGDCDGHGSNCASIAAGNTNGWATGSKIYSMRIVSDGTNGPYTDITSGATLGLVNEIKAWQTIRAWHNAKPIDPATGYKRPTIITGSYGYSESYSSGSITSINYRGTSYSVNTTTGIYGTIGVPQSGSGEFGYRYTAVEAEITSCVNAGIIVVCASGNNSHKIDVVGGADYNNYCIMSDAFYNRPYHRGGTPGASPGVVCVGALDNMTTAYDNKAKFSCTGPRIDIFAPGVAIMGAYANSPYYTSAIADSRSSVSTSSGATYYLNKVSGTSQATPQVTGVIACLLQARPWMTGTDVTNWLKSVGGKGYMNENAFAGQTYATGTYTNLASLQGAANTILYQPFNLPDPLTIRG